MLRIVGLTIFLLGSSLTYPSLEPDPWASQVSQMKDEAQKGSGTKALFSLVNHLFGVVENTGDVISQLSKNYADLPHISQAGEMISAAGADIPGVFNDLVQGNFQKVLELVPGIKNNITEALDQLPMIREKISNNIAKLVASESIKENIQSVFNFLPENNFVDDIKRTIEEQVDKLPPKEYIEENIQLAFNIIPSADYVNSKIDEFVDQVSPIVEEVNETAGRK
eukprot:GFUD01028358.1.p1 GENE.GFUD01028358.1~~GFUD01028358.1.p1  ORF type:complete len:242 (+),score=61.57 GFUD01028358.1:55-726(+)